MKDGLNRFNYFSCLSTNTETLPKTREERRSRQRLSLKKCSEKLNKILHVGSTQRSVMEAVLTFDYEFIKFSISSASNGMSRIKSIGLCFVINKSFSKRMPSPSSGI